MGLIIKVESTDLEDVSRTPCLNLKSQYLAMSLIGEFFSHGEINGNNP